jgi:hypothetical protein
VVAERHEAVINIPCSLTCQVSRQYVRECPTDPRSSIAASNSRIHRQGVHPYRTIAGRTSPIPPRSTASATTSRGTSSAAQTRCLRSTTAAASASASRAAHDARPCRYLGRCGLLAEDCPGRAYHRAARG